MYELDRIDGDVENDIVREPSNLYDLSRANRSGL